MRRWKRRYEKYDYITIMLEYAACYTDNENPLVICFSWWSAICPGGKIVIAIENRLGLKILGGLVPRTMWAVSSRTRGWAIPTRRMSTPFRERS